MNDRDLTRKQALLQSVDARIRSEEAAVGEKEADTLKTTDIIDKARESLISTIEVMKLMLPRLLLNENGQAALGNLSPQSDNNQLGFGPSGSPLGASAASNTTPPSPGRGAGPLGGPGAGGNSLDVVTALVQKHVSHPVIERPQDATTTELLTYLELVMQDFREFLAPQAVFRLLRRPTIQRGVTRKPVDLPHVRIEDSDSDADELPLSRSELQQAVKKNLHHRRRRK